MSVLLSSVFKEEKERLDRISKEQKENRLIKSADHLQIAVKLLVEISTTLTEINRKLPDRNPWDDK